MSKRKVIVNLGLARCGTTASDKLVRNCAEIASPKNVKELKFFFDKKDTGKYFQNFDNSSAELFFESSPPYMHNGLDRFETVLHNILNIKDEHTDVVLLFNIRNLIKRAFSHYWHDINGQYAIHGRLWKVRQVDDPRRFSALYQKSFIDEVESADNDAKFLPAVGEMIQSAIAAVGAGNVKIAHTSNLDQSIGAFWKEVAGLSLGQVPRVPGTRCPAYLYGGEAGKTYTLKVSHGAEDIEIPAQTLLLFARRHAETLSGTDYDLERIFAASQKWSRDVDARDLPARILDYQKQQLDIISALPEECFLAGLKDEVVSDLRVVPEHLSISKAEPAISEVRKMVWERQSELAESDGKVIAGRNERLFLHYDMNQVIPQHTGEILLSDTEVENWCNILRNRTEYCRNLGLPYSKIFAPDTHAVHKGDIPLLDGISAKRPVLQILDAYDGDNLHYPLKEMQEASVHGEVCHVTDSHWSPYGAYIAYRVLMENMPVDTDVLSDADIVLRDHRLVGDLGAKFTPPRAGRTTLVEIKRSHSEKIWNNGVTNRGHMSFWRGRKRALPSALLLTDSYGWKFQKFLAESVSDLFVVHSPLLEKEAIERFKPDFVVSLQAERFAQKVPDDDGPETALKQAKDKNAGSEYPDFSKFTEKTTSAGG